MNINKLDGYEFNEQDKFNGFSVSTTNGSTDNGEIQEIKAKNQSQDEEIKKVSDSNKLQDEEIKKLTVDIAEDNNVFTISQGGKELAKIHQLEGKSASIVSGSLENGNLILTKDNAQTVNVDMGQLALKSSVPTKVSQLENDSEFMTGETLLPQLEGKANVEHTHKLQDITDYIVPVVPTKISQLENDSNLLTSSVASTTYSTKSELNSLETKLEQMINSNNGELHFTGTTLNGITSLAAAIQTLANKLDSEDHL